MSWGFKIKPTIDEKYAWKLLFYGPEDGNLKATMLFETKFKAERYMEDFQKNV